MQHATTTELVPVEATQEITTPINPVNILDGMYCSLKADTREEKLMVFKAVSNAEALDDHLGERIDVQDIMIQPVELPDPLTGELKVNNRITLITTDGKAYRCVSKGVENVVKNLFGIMGTPPWTGGISLVASKRPGNNGYKYTNLELYEGK